MYIEPSNHSEKPAKETSTKFEYQISIVALTALSVIYLYLLLSPTQKHVSTTPKHFVIRPDTKQAFDRFLTDFKSAQGGYSSSWGWDKNSSGYDDIYRSYKEWGKEGHADDFFLDQYQSQYEETEIGSFEPITPSSNFRCKSNAWITMRSEVNYKYLWMHQENHWMSATATMDTPLHLRSFEMFPVNQTCENGGGWVRLREGDSQGFIFMVPPSPSSNAEEWTIQIGSTDLDSTNDDPRYHFLFEEEGYLVHRGTMGCLNVLSQAEFTVRGHTGGWDRTQPAGREFGAMMHFQFLNSSLITESQEREREENEAILQQDQKDIQEIRSLPSSSLDNKEKRVISFGLYGGKEKYTGGAIRNAELAPLYFPGWTPRFYVTSDVPSDVIEKLKSLNCEIFPIPSGMGYSSGMFWRFLVASDDSVDRFIVRDVDSRLNARDRFAVEEWIQSGYPVHILRDHINHCIPMNGGMWGGVKGALSFMKDKVMEWKGRDEYMADLRFLEASIWPEIKFKQFAHDSNCCDRYPNTHPFPRRRPANYQHVGQVFDAQDSPRLGDIDGFIRGVPVPGPCRKDPEWIYG